MAEKYLKKYSTFLAGKCKSKWLCDFILHFSEWLRTKLKEQNMLAGVEQSELSSSAGGTASLYKHLEIHLLFS